jgi:hypothetical protein
MIKKMLQDQFKWYLEHQNELVKKYEGKSIVIVDFEIVGVYDDDLSALIDTRKNHEIGTFLIQKCTKGNQDYTQTFHSRVAFV